MTQPWKWPVLMVEDRKVRIVGDAPLHDGRYVHEEEMKRREQEWQDSLNEMRALAKQYWVEAEDSKQRAISAEESAEKWRRLMERSA